MAGFAERLEAEARAWVGTPFVLSGFVQGKGGGVDCGRLVVGVLQRLGVLDIDMDALPTYPAGWFLHRTGDDCYREWLDQHMIRVEGPPCVGDVLAFERAGKVCHIALQLPQDRLLHSLDRVGAHISAAADGPFLGPPAAIYRSPQMAEA